MKATIISVLYVGFASAHYAIKSLVIDGNQYVKLKVHNCVCFPDRIIGFQLAMLDWMRWSEPSALSGHSRTGTISSGKQQIMCLILALLVKWDPCLRDGAQANTCLRWHWSQSSSTHCTRSSWSQCYVSMDRYCSTSRWASYECKSTLSRLLICYTNTVPIVSWVLAKARHEARAGRLL